ncbi:MAG TPA: LacI family DNA-binding transcriptional regulator [Candidatus Acidoferrum sp.]|nr:LacI family DNA-binding transcriptional regulator [Candidatus Acidoferrum sp.]
MTPNSKRAKASKENVVTLKEVARHVGLTPGTVSAVLNNSAASRSIPDSTRQRILAAARELNYRPNMLARSLRVQRTFTIGVILQEIGDGYGSSVVSGIEEFLSERDFFFLTVAHRHDKKQLQSYSDLLISRGVEGFITVDTSISEKPALPTVAVAGHKYVADVTNITLDHRKAAELALHHLKSLGHEKIAFLKGQVESSDSLVRWEAICAVAQEMGLTMRPELVVQLEGKDSTPELGYPFGKQLLARNVAFTALFAYNDISAIGAMRAFQEAGKRVPEDISVVGFDDINIASFSRPTLTTVRQPLKKMGRIAAKTLLDWIEGRSEYTPEIAVEPELVIRNSASTNPHARK